jgi:hypothetical protein
MLATKVAIEVYEQKSRFDPLLGEQGLARLSNRLRPTQPQKEMTLPRMRRKAYLSGFYETALEGFFTARLNPCPSCRDAFPSACLAFTPRPTEKSNLDKV